MKVLVLRITLRASWVHSLKEKRMVLLSLTKRLSNNFNLSIAEVDDQDIHQSIVIGIAVIGVSMKILEAMKEKILDFIEENTDAEIKYTVIQAAVLTAVLNSINPPSEILTGQS